MALEDWRCECGHMTYLHDHPDAKPGLCHAHWFDTKAKKRNVCKCKGYRPKGGKKVRF